MSTTEVVSTRHFPVRHDGWDLVENVLWLVVLVPGTCWSIFSDIQDFERGATSWSPSMISLFWVALLAYIAGIKVWQYFAEEYVMTADALIFEYGYRRLYVPFEEIRALHPMKVCRITTALKPAHRINFRTPIGGERAADAYPIDDAAFLEELTARCPHLQRDGERMHLRAATGAPAST